MDIERFLLEKEQRVKYQNNLQNRYDKTLVIIKANYPSENKNTVLANNIVDEINKEFKKLLHKYIIYEEIYINLEGKLYIYILDDNAITIKQKAIKIEEMHHLGRYVDIDVYDKNISLSRSQFNIAPRKCYKCSQYAKYCARNMSHSTSELIDIITEKYRNYLSHQLSTIAIKSAIYEVLTYPSFGLVSHINNGSHTDMNMYSFIESIFSFEKYLYEVAYLGYSDIPLDEAFNKTREIGKIAEKHMFISTNNVNTHKGLIFLIMIVILSISRSKYTGNENISEIIKEISKNILDDFKNIDKDNLTHGELIYIKYGLTGVRGEVHTGLQKVFNVYLPKLKEYLSKYNKNIALSKTLINIMADLDDTTILYRHNIEMLENIKRKANELKNEDKLEKIMKFDKYCIDNNISPGGSADLLVITLLLHELSL